ncbi:hypothetical protein DYB38_005754 [Aphanomyces astaci]|uniref:Uncharacterized protein n=1 Tax=Aphanomyces astaci TaxID=112090 RepID=A0A397C247_APHAT|nr:hypothetical protein DYB38_005754 [Aphanomyces astaci]
MSRLRSEDDLALWIKANHERPFLQHLVMKSWGCSRATCLKFLASLAKLEVDGKKTLHRFHLILDNHEKFQKDSVYLDGVDRRMHYDMAPYAIWAIRVGSSKISRGDKHSYRMTAALSVRGNGEKLSILFILRGIPGGLIEQGKFDDFPIGTFMQFKKRRGWMHACGLFT